MTYRSGWILTASAAALVLACGGNSPAPGPEPEQLQPTAEATATQEELTDDRVIELARGYVELLQARDFERLWQHVSPEARQRIGSLDEFRSGSEAVLNRLGAEVGMISETVEPARAGMVADKLYFRVSHYAGAKEGPVRLLVGLKNDGSIAGFNVQRAE